jgi:hypothetical protein
MEFYNFSQLFEVGHKAGRLSDMWRVKSSC